jgi:ADP-ribosyl-[dinitrogen reductase] hydrolase
MSLQSKEIIDRAIGMAFGAAIGDAMGIPFENLTPKQIAGIQMSRNKNELLFVNAAGRNPYISKDWATGRWGDATQLSLAIMHGIAQYLCNNTEKLPLIQSIVDEHVREWRDCTDGWGNGTKSAIEKIAQGSYSYHNSGGLSTGNGVIMKLTPIAFFFHICKLNVDDSLIEAVCRMTHTSPVTVATAFIYTYLCVFIFEHDSPASDVERKAFLQYVYDLSITYESKYNLVIQKELLSIRIQRYLEKIDEINNELLLDVSQGGTFFCVDTLSMVVGLIAAKQMTFETLEKALEMGGDTNIVASMIGALLGATQGQQAIDHRRIDIVFRSDYVRQVGEEFGQALAQHLHLFPMCP